MKTSTAFAAFALVVVLSLDAVSGMKIFLQKFPNGGLAFTKSLGHVSDSSDDLNDFGNMFSAEGNEYTAKLCQSTFPGTPITVGAAFGDPCCTWKAGGKPAFTVDPFVKPAKATTCASASGSGAPPSPASAAGSRGSSSNASTPAPAPTPTTASPSAGSGSNAPTSAPASGSNSSGSLAPASTPKLRHRHKCHTKKDKKKEKDGKKMENKSLDEDSDDK